MISKVAIAGTCAGLAGAGWLAYSCYSPTSQLYGRTLAYCPSPTDLALTFDDGPNDVHTERLLDVLARHEVNAAFFLIGKFVAQRPQIARRIVDAGHLLGNHSYSHPNMLFLSREKMRDELSTCSKAIANATGVIPRFFRPPWGARRPAVLEIARELELEPVMWSATCYDWKGITADAIERNARKRIEADSSRGQILLLHDGGYTGVGADRSQTIEATERLILRYKNSHSFRRIDRLQQLTAASSK